MADGFHQAPIYWFRHFSRSHKHLSRAKSVHKVTKTQCFVNTTSFSFCVLRTFLWPEEMEKICQIPSYPMSYHSMLPMYFAHKKVGIVSGGLICTNTNWRKMIWIDNYFTICGKQIKMLHNVDHFLYRISLGTKFFNH